MNYSLRSSSWQAIHRLAIMRRNSLTINNEKGYASGMQIPFEFLQKQKAISIACHAENEIWIANVYIGVSEGGKMYFVSPKDNRHGAMILKNPNIAFSSIWFNPTNPKNRKGIQGLGTCRMALDDKEIEAGVRLHNENFPEFKERITVEWIRKNEWGSTVWVIEPTSIKYWDDELYGEEESEEFSFHVR